MTTRIIVAPDKFRGSLDAAGVARALAAGIRSVIPDAVVVECPVADGGEGSVACAVAAGWEPRTRTVTGPVGIPIEASYAVSPDGATAMIELAAASGIDRLPLGPDGPVLDPRNATSRGTGELVVAALDDGCTSLVLAVGGSACTDGGAGLVAALGAGLYDASGASLPDGGAALEGLVRLELAGFDRRLGEVRVVLAADVDNPLLSRRGAAAVFGPQKGATMRDVADLDAALAHWANVVGDAVPGAGGTQDAAGAGAAGGVGFAAMAFLHATMRPGAELLLELIGFDELTDGASLVVTGEGSLDPQSLGGKTPIVVARHARERGIPVTAACGRNQLSHDEIRDAGFESVHAMLDLEPDPVRSMSAPRPLLERIGADIARAHSSNSSSSL